MSGKGKAISAVMIITLVSKCLGFLRDMILAYYYGAGSVTDAYCIAQTIPEFLFSLVIQAIAVGFIPTFIGIVEGEGKDKAWSFTDNLGLVGVMLVTVVVFAVYAFTDAIVYLFASGFNDETAALASLLTRVSIWGLFFRIIAAIDSALLNANEQFTIPALTGFPLDVITIASIVLASYTNQPVLLAVGILLSYTSQMVLQRPFVRRVKPKIDLRSFNLRDPHLLKMLALFFPVAIGVGANQINILVDKTLASSFVGGVSSLNYANKVNNVFENVMILSLATVMFPSFSKYAARGDNEALTSSIVKSCLVTMIVMVPCSIAAFVCAEDIIRLLFGRGVFDDQAISMTAHAMQCYAVGLAFLSVNAILTRAIYGFKKVMSVSLCSCCSLVVNVGLSFTFVLPWGVPGVALATSIANIVQMVLLSYCLKKRIGGLWVRSLARPALKILASSTVFSVLLFSLYNVLKTHVLSLLACVIAVLAGGLIYFILLYALRVEIVRVLIRKLSRIFRDKTTD